MIKLQKSIAALFLFTVALLYLNFTFTKIESPKGKWETLFNGKNFTSWKGYLKENVPSAWQIEGDAMVLNGSGGDIVTIKEYGNFELELEWKISEGGNSGIMYHVHEDPKFSNTYTTGPEMQIIDNEHHPDAKAGKNNNRVAGSLYDMIAPSDLTTCKPAGQWNVVRLIINNGKAEHYINGKKIVEYPIRGPQWDKMVSESKFKTWEAFAKYPVGHIALQDHGNKVWFRNIRIREL